MAHPYLEEKHCGGLLPLCPRCGHWGRKFHLGPPRKAGLGGRGKRANGGTLGWKCQRCDHFQPSVLVHHAAL